MSSSFSQRCFYVWQFAESINTFTYIFIKSTAKTADRERNNDIWTVSGGVVKCWNWQEQEMCFTREPYFSPIFQFSNNVVVFSPIYSHCAENPLYIVSPRVTGELTTDAQLHTHTHTLSHFAHKLYAYCNGHKYWIIHILGRNRAHIESNLLWMHTQFDVWQRNIKRVP